MSEPARKRATYEDLLDLPENLQGEIIDGELVVSPQPRPRHIRAAFWLASEIARSFDRYADDPEDPTGGWWILPEPEVHLEEQIVIPDVAGWREERMPELPDDDEAFIALPPDWVCEVLSPSTARTDRLLKMRLYAAHGVGFVWLVDPAIKTLEVFSLAGDYYRLVELFQGDVKARALPFEALELNLEHWWRRTKRKAP